MAQKSSNLKIGLIATGIVLGAGFATVAAKAGRRDGFIPEGVKVAGMDWSGKSTATARAELEGWSKAREEQTLPLTLPKEVKRNRVWKPKRSDVGARIDIDATLQAAERVGSEDGAFKRIMQVFSGHKAVDLEPVWKIDEAQAKAYLVQRVAPRARQAEKDAKFLIIQGQIQITPEEQGASLDIQESLRMLLDRAPSSDNSEPLTLPVKTVKPRILSDDLKDLKTEIFTFRTRYSETGNRRKNIETACAKINGTVLKPGDVFSYNKVVGPREAEHGFRMAPVIVSGKLVPGMGGGICQVSTTLYNAVLYSDLKVVERSHHAFPVHYVAPGRDATVSYPDKDFKFQNTTDGLLAIVADGTGGKVEMRLFGKTVPGREVELQRVNVSSWGGKVNTVKDPNVPLGKTVTVDKGHAGHRVTLVRLVKMNGQLVRKETVSRDVYSAFPKIVAVGTKAAGGALVPGASIPGGAPPVANGPVGQVPNP